MMQENLAGSEPGVLGPALKKATDALLAQGSIEEPSGMWQCPAHTDETPSLSVSQGNKGAVLYCHAGCTTDVVLQTLGLSAGDLFDDSPGPKKPPEGPKAVEATYPYVDAEGSPVSTKIRYAPKSFSWTGGNPDVLYHLPAVLAASRVYVNEGEKAADAIREKVGDDVAATCAPTTAWEESFTEVLKGKRVIVWVDRDEAGRKQAATAIRSLQGAGVKVTAVQSKVDEDHADAYDHLAAGYELDEAVEVDLGEILKLAETSSTDQLTLWPIGDLLAMPPANHTWLVEERLLSGGTSILAGKPKCGKTTLARSLMLSVARGEPWMGFDVAQGPVVFLALEGRLRDHVEELRRIGAAETDPIYVLDGSGSPAMMARLLPQLREIQPALIVIDPLQRLLRVQDLNNYAEVTNAFDDTIYRVTREAGAHVMALHHSRKADHGGIDEVLGSTAIVGTVDTILVVKRSGGQRILTSVQRIGEELEPLAIHLDPETHRTHPAAAKAMDPIADIEQRILDYLKTNGQWAKRDEIEASVEGKSEMIRKALARLVQEQRICEIGAGVKGSPRRYTGCDVEPDDNDPEAPGQVVPWHAPPSTDDQLGGPDAS